MSWVGKRMMNPKGEIGKVISDTNGNIRVLIVKFEDDHTEELVLANVGQNPKESQLWKWEFKRDDGTKEWVEWGY